MKKMSKNKWILGGIVAFASVALISTGFAAWQIGQTLTTADNTISVNVSGVSNTTVLLTASLTDSSITLGDNIISNGTYVNSTADDQDFKIDGTIRLEVSPDYVKNNTIKSVNLSFINNNVGETYASNKVTGTEGVNATGFHTVTKGSISDLTYFDLVNTSITFPKLETDGSISGTESGWTKGTNNGNNYVYVYTISDGSNFFKWGTYFGSEDSVSAYYNEQITSSINNLTNADATTKAQKASELSSYVQTELKAMANQLNNKSICLEMKLSVNASSSNTTQEG